MFSSEIKHKSAPSYYEASVVTRPSFAPLTGTEKADVCIVGGGIAGCSAALELAARGLRVVLLEAERIGWGASGRNGGQIIPGFACDQPALDDNLGADDAQRLWDISVESIRLLRQRIERHAIRCDWQSGQIQVAVKPRHGTLLRAWQTQLDTRYGYSSARLLDGQAVAALLGTRRYCAGLYDANAGHLHPLKYTLGLANAAKEAGAILYEGSPVVSLQPGKRITLTTPQGAVDASFAVLCGNAYLGDLVPDLRNRIMPVETYVIATEPLGERRACELIRDNCGVTDTNFILDYFRLSADRRLLFGGRVSYSARDRFDTVAATRKRMLKVFPQLADAKIEFAWSGLLDITMNRAPDFGRLESNLYYLQGFSGHGVALAGMAGKLAADAIGGQAERFDLFGKIRHRNFPGGRLLRTPALVFAMLWYRLRDLL